MGVGLKSQKIDHTICNLGPFISQVKKIEDRDSYNKTKSLSDTHTHKRGGLKGKEKTGPKKVSGLDLGPVSGPFSAGRRSLPASPDHICWLGTWEGRSR